MMSRQFVISGLCSTLFALSALAQAEPNLICDEPTYSFGTLASTQVVTHSFLLRNIGGKTAVITRVHSTCGCTTVNPTRMEIPPGESEPLTAHFDPHNKFGVQNRALYVGWKNVSNFPLRLAFEGMVIPATKVKIEPRQISFSALSSSVGHTTRVVRIVSPYTNGSFRITGSSCNMARFATRIEEIVPGFEYLLHVTDTQPTVEESVSAVVTITTQDSAVPTITIPVQRGRSSNHFWSSSSRPSRGTRKPKQADAEPRLGDGNFRTDPDYLAFGIVAPTGSITRTARVFAVSTNKSFHVTLATCPDSTFTTRVETVADGREYRVQVSSSGPRKPGAVSTVVTIQTDHPTEKLIDIPVFMRVREMTAP